MNKLFFTSVRPGRGIHHMWLYLMFPVVIKTQKVISLSSLGYGKNMAASEETTHSRCKYKVFKYKGPIYKILMKYTNENITRIIEYSISANRSRSHKPDTLIL